MSLLQMSLYGGIMILVIVVIRAISINQLPKRTFIALWAVALIRLLIPFSLPSALSAYSLVQSTPAARVVMDTTTTLPIEPVKQMTDGIREVNAVQPSAPVRLDLIIWIAGAMICAGFFAISYIKCRREFSESLPVQNEFADKWLENHSLRRKISIRQSGRISAPLTYGIFRPVILMPKTAGWENEQQLRYVLEHEYVHIKRCDALTKILLILAVCIHWFNPLVWVMFILSNRDIELSCDEAVVRIFGENTKSAYALTLIGMEETKGGLTPLLSGFSKNAIEERITAIMKIKKTSILAIVIAMVLIVGVAAGFATSGMTKEYANSDKTLDEKGRRMLNEFKFEGYENMSVSEYQEKAWALLEDVEYSEWLSRITQNNMLYNMKDSNDDASFLHYTLEPLTAEEFPSWSFNGCPDYSISGNMEATLEYLINLTITDTNKVTVGEYSGYSKRAMYALESFESFIQSMSVEVLADEAVFSQRLDAAIDKIISQKPEGLEIDIVYEYHTATEDYTDIQAQLMTHWEETLAPYMPFGVTFTADYSEDYGIKMYFEGKEVRGIFDSYLGEWVSEHAGNGFYSDDAIELFAVYEGDILTGLREADEEEMKFWDSQRDKTHPREE